MSNTSSLTDVIFAILWEGNILTIKGYKFSNVRAIIGGAVFHQDTYASL